MKKEFENRTKEELEDLRTEFQNEKNLLEFADFMFGTEKQRWNELRGLLSQITRELKKFEPKPEWVFCGFWVNTKEKQLFLENNKETYRFDSCWDGTLCVEKRRSPN